MVVLRDPGLIALALDRAKYPDLIDKPFSKFFYKLMDEVSHCSQASHCLPRACVFPSSGAPAFCQHGLLTIRSMTADDCLSANIQSPDGADVRPPLVPLQLMDLAFASLLLFNVPVPSDTHTNQWTWQAAHPEGHSCSIQLEQHEVQADVLM